MLELNRIDRVRGCLLGLAVGDALGAPLEGLTAQQIRAHYGQVDDFVDGCRAWRRKPYRWRLPGLYTDDTQQALAICDVLLDHGRIDQDRLAEIYLALATPRGSYVGAHRGVGRSFRQVLIDLENGVSPHRTGQLSAGIGAAMRIAPVALYFGTDEIDAIFEAVMNASLMTHRDVRSLTGALAVAHTVRRLMDGESREPSLLFRVAADVARDESRMIARYPEVTSVVQHRGSLSQAIARVESFLEMPRDRALSSLIEEANRHGTDPVCKRPTMGFPPACIPACLYVLLTTESVDEAIVEIVNMGGDADTAGAILGAFGGAHYGADAIPARWLCRLQNREAIELRAMALSERSADGLNIPDLVERERELSELENSNREDLLTHAQNGGDLGANRNSRL
jgi:ADP-ribosyl-[dinitrogen reductase] hydrolase